TILQHTTKRVVERLDCVSRVDDLADLRRVIEEGGQLRPVAPPTFSDSRILRVPLARERLELLLGGGDGWSGIDLAQIARHFFAMLVVYVAQRVSDLMHDAQLQARAWKDRLNRLLK